MRDLLREWWEKKFFRIVAYIGFTLILFVAFLLMTFPQHRVKQIVSVQLESALDNRYEVNIEDMGFWRLTGVQMRGVRIRERQRVDPAAANMPNAPMPMTVQINRISARFAPVRSLLNRGPTVNYQVDTGGGIIDGSFYQVGHEQHVKARVNRLDLQRSTLLASLLGVPLFGVLEGDVALQIDGRAGTVTSGKIDFTGSQLTLGTTTIRSEQIPIFTELELPTTNFGNLRADIIIEPGEGRSSRVNVRQFQSQGRDIQLEAWGHVDMMHGGGSRPRLEMRMQVNQEYVTENSLGVLFNMQEFRNGRAGQWYGFVLGGASGNISFQGSTTAARGPEPAAADTGEAAAEAEPIEE